MSEPTGVETTGRFLVLFEEGAVDAGLLELASIAGADEGGEPAEVFPTLGVAVVSADPTQLAELNNAAERPGPVLVVEPERVVHAIDPVAAEEEEALAVDETVLTWGLRAVGADVSGATGKGVRVAVLDTGFTTAHADFAGRSVTTNSFINGETVEDGNGHGTHCIGSSCGPRKPASGPGYGVAFEAEIFAGKVLSNRGSGSDGGILAGIEWAVTNNCSVISMSLGADVPVGTPPSQIYEAIAQRCLAKGTIIIAAAGNGSRRPATIAPVGHPARCPSILAVGAVDVNKAIAFFSASSRDAIGQVDVVAPGVDVHSSWKGPEFHKRIQGTSMATPHVSGVAALMVQKLGVRGWELWARLMATSRRLDLPSVDAGAGMVQAP